MPNKPTFEELEQRVKELEQDTARRKQVEIGLRQSEEQFRTLSEASLEAIFLSENGICLEQNQTAVQMFGYKHSEAIGKPGTNWIVPDDRKRVKNHMLSGYVARYNVGALRKDGTSFPAEIQGKLIQIGRAHV